MEARTVASALNLMVRAGEEGLGRNIQGGFASDLLSHAMANARAGDVWVTHQTHQNIVAVAVLTEMAAVIIAGGQEPEPETINKANQEHIPIFTSLLPLFEIVGRLYAMGVRGRC